MKDKEAKMTDVNIAAVMAVVDEARSVARGAAQKYFQEKLGGVDRFACGFAWVNVYGVKGSTKLGKALIAAGFRKGYGKGAGLQLWNPSQFPCQNVDTLEAGAVAAAQVISAKLGVKAYAGSRLD